MKVFSCPLPHWSLSTPSIDLVCLSASTRFSSTFLGISTDFSGYGSNANIFDLSSDQTKDINVGEDFFHWSLGFDWNLNWASFVLGTTYTSGSSSFNNPLNISGDGIDFDDPATSKISFNRWQFVVGIEVPFLDAKIKNSQISK